MQFPDNHLKIGILGAKGFLGSDLVRFLGKNYITDAITRENYEKKRGTSYQVLINANGNSKRFWANQNPLKDFFASTATVARSVFDFPCDLYIYISSPDVYQNHTSSKYTGEERVIDLKKLSPYGFHKYLSELIVKKYKENFLILRLSMILGKNLKKGPFYDIKNGKPLYITSSSRLQLITTRAISEIIEILLKHSVTKETINIGGRGTFSFQKIRKHFDQEIKILPEAETQIYEMNIEKVGRLYPNLKTSEQYLQEFLKDYIV